MNLVSGTKIFFGQRTIQKRVRRKDIGAQVCNLGDAKKIGVIYNATHIVSYDIIKNLTKSLSNKGVEVSALGFVQSQKLIDHYLYRKGFEFFTKSQLNWYGKPTGDGIDAFINQAFDILIDLSLEKCYPVDYIVASSNANFKVGRYFKESNYLDLMIDMEKEIETMHDIQKEIEKDKKAKVSKREMEIEVKPKIEIEIQLNFLINQLMHYLSVVKMG